LQLYPLRETSTKTSKVELSVKYKDRAGQEYCEKAIIKFETEDLDKFPNTGIHKATVLVRYVNLLHMWISGLSPPQSTKKTKQKKLQERKKRNKDDFYKCKELPRMNFDPIFPLGQDKVTGKPLTPTKLEAWNSQKNYKESLQPYRDCLESFIQYFEKETEKIGDSEMNKEKNILQRLLKAATDK